MYLKSVELENTGPIDRLNYQFPFIDDERPRPVVFVGHNGSGKSIVLANLANGILVAKAVIYEDSEVEKGKVYKLRSTAYIRHNQNYSISKIFFSEGFHQKEIDLDRSPSAFEDEFKYTPLFSEWQEIPKDGLSYFTSNYGNDLKKLKLQVSNSCLLYFPANRFEEPAWLNEESLINRAQYPSLSRMVNDSNRPIISTAPLKKNQDWLLDILYDSFAIERTIVHRRVPNLDINIPFAEVHGPANRGRDAGYPAPPAQIRAGALTHTAPASGQTSAALSATCRLARLRGPQAACVTRTRHSVRYVLWPVDLPLAPVLRSIDSAGTLIPLFADFTATMTESDSSSPFVSGYDSSVFPSRPRH